MKHAGRKHTVEIDPDSTGEMFKYQLFSLTNVEPERQKILVRGGQLKDDQDMSKLGLKNGATLMMMGTPSGGPGEIRKPEGKTKFLEDMTEAEVAQSEGATPAGLTNLGNTCYLNSTLQTLRAIPELQQVLASYKTTSNASSGLSTSGLSRYGLEALAGSSDLTANLRDLYKQMSETQEGFPPMLFLNAFRQAYPQFAEQSRDGRYAQQDAEEAWSQIVTTLRGKLKSEVPPETPASGADQPSASQNANTKVWVDEYLGGVFTRTEAPLDPAAIAAGEAATTKPDEKFYKLDCHVASKDVNHLSEGITAALSDTYMKRSDALGRDAEYKQTSRIARLPKYLPVHFMRFYWKNDVRKKAKILRKVTFQHELDAVEYCNEDLRSQLLPVRNKIRELRKETLDVERARKRQKRMREGQATEADQERNEKDAKDRSQDAKSRKTPKPTAGDKSDAQPEEETYKTDAEIEAERDARLLSLKKDLLAAVSPKLAEDKMANQSGLYELRGVITHKGASADSGHYTAYVKKEVKKDSNTGSNEEDKWWWFDDDKVTEVDGDKIEMLSGGGETHSALILLYRAVELPTLSESERSQ